jgi:hypothetical protein
VEEKDDLKARDLAGMATMVVLAVSAFLFAVYFGLYPSLMVSIVLVVVVAINIRNWRSL